LCFRRRTRLLFRSHASRKEKSARGYRMVFEQRHSAVETHAMPQSTLQSSSHPAAISQVISQFPDLARFCRVGTPAFSQVFPLCEFPTCENAGDFSVDSAVMVCTQSSWTPSFHMCCVLRFCRPKEGLQEHPAISLVASTGTKFTIARGRDRRL
jgi:hypothetical protein